MIANHRPVFILKYKRLGVNEGVKGSKNLRCNLKQTFVFNSKEGQHTISAHTCTYMYMH